MFPKCLIAMLFAAVLFPFAAYSQTPNLEPGVSHDLAKWRAAHYSDVRYKLNLTLEKMSPVLKGTMEIRVIVRDTETRGSGDAASKSEPPALVGGPNVGTDAANRSAIPIILDWRKIKGHEKDSTITNVSVNGKSAVLLAGENHPVAEAATPLLRKEGSRNVPLIYNELNDHLIFREGVVPGENVIKLDFTSPILTSGSAITRYIDKEDGSEYIYSLFVPSDASTAFPVFDQPDLKARFRLTILSSMASDNYFRQVITNAGLNSCNYSAYMVCAYGETKPISTYVFAFAAGPFERFQAASESTTASSRKVKNKLADIYKTWKESDVSHVYPERVSVPSASADGENIADRDVGATHDRTADAVRRPTTDAAAPPADAGGTDKTAPPTSIYIRKSQAEKFKPHAADVFRLNREAVEFFEEYFDYKFPFPKYDIVLIPEFPFGGMEHAGATFLKESSVIFPQEPTKNDEISRATLIFHEAAHQWFGDTVTMRWFDDLWLKEGFANFMAYKALEKIMPEANAWKVFYERVKQAAYRTDSTKGTTPIYQKIDNLSAAKSAYGNIVYNKAPAFLRQAEFYIGEDKFQTAVRAFLKKHEYSNATWEDLVKEFEAANKPRLRSWADVWITQKGVPLYRTTAENFRDLFSVEIQEDPAPTKGRKYWWQKVRVYGKVKDGDSHLTDTQDTILRSPPVGSGEFATLPGFQFWTPDFVFPNYQDYGYGIFLLDEKSREYVLKNIQNEKDPFLRSMMWGALWDSVREGELDPKEYVKLAVKILSPGFSRQPPKGGTPNGENHPVAEAATPLLRKEGSLNEDESTTALLLGRVGTALNYYIADEASEDGQAGMFANPALRERIENMLIERMQNEPSLGQRITYYRAFLRIGASEKARNVLKEVLAGVNSPHVSVSSPHVSVSSPHVSKGPTSSTSNTAPSLTVGLPTLRTKDKFDIVTRLIILRDPEALKLLERLEKTETSDDAKRYAYAARAGIATPENKAKYWNDFVNNKDISESWIEAALGPWNSLRQSDLTLPYLERALKELPNHKRSRKIFFVNGWLGAFIGGQRSEEALGIINKFLADNPKLDNDLRLKILENADTIERAVKIRSNFPYNFISLNREE